MAATATNTAWSGPWGVSYTANLPHPAPMPIPMYKHFTDADLEAIFSYLQSIPPVKNRVPEPLPPADAHADAASR